MPSGGPQGNGAGFGGAQSGFMTQTRGGPQPSGDFGGFGGFGGLQPSGDKPSGAPEGPKPTGAAQGGMQN